MFIGRRPDGTLYGAWTSRQPNDADHPGMEEVGEDHPDLVAFQNRPVIKAKSLVEQILSDPQFQLLKDEIKKP